MKPGLGADDRLIDLSQTAREGAGIFIRGQLVHDLTEYLAHYHKERCHQGIGNVIPFPVSQAANDRKGTIECHERLGGTLKFYERKAA